MRIPWPKAVLLLITWILAGSSLAQTETDHSFTTLPLNPGQKIMDVPGQNEDVLNIREQFAIDSDSIVKTRALAVISMQVDSVLRSDSVTSVIVKGFASIDGPVALNNRLAKGRAQAMKDWLTKSTAVNPSLISIEYNGEDWAWFEALVKGDPNMPAKDDVLRILNSGKSGTVKQKELKALRGGEVWRYMAKNTFPVMRVADVTIGDFTTRVIIEEVAEVEIEETPVVEVVTVEEVPEVEIVEAPVVEEVTVEEVPEPEIVEAPVVEVVTVEEVVETPTYPAMEEDEEWIRKLYVKTNVPAWAMLWQNIAVEVDLAKHWSFSVPVYWSPYNYGKQTLKFRTLAVVPEFRYWPKADNTGFFVNAHFGMAYYNYAKNEEYRYQDHNGKTPALGGGLGLGYRFYFCRNHHWAMEAALGAGVYKLDYDIFMNTPSTKHGYLVGRRQRTFFGIDQAAFTISYSFGLKKRTSK